MNEKNMFLQDGRDYQILCLSSFLFLGIFTRDWTLRIDLMGAILVSCLLTQIVGVLVIKYFQNNQELNFSLRSALITSLSLCLLLRANDYITVAIAASLAIGSKFLFRFQGKHFFNPANFGIIAALIITNDAWVSPGQWGNDWWYLLFFVSTASLVLNKVGRWDTSGTFLLTYGALEAIRYCWLGWSVDVWQQQLMSGSLLIFAFFMISDPRSIPNHYIARLIWSIGLAVLTFILRDYFFVSTAMFWALFILSPFTIVLDYIWSAPRFVWQNKSLKYI